MIHNDCVIFHCIKNADSVLVQNIFLKIIIIKIQGKGASTGAIFDFSPAWKFPMVPKLKQAGDEFCLERNLAPFVPSAFSSWPSKARFADAGLVPGPGPLGQWEV